MVNILILEGEKNVGNVLTLLWGYNVCVIRFMALYMLMSKGPKICAAYMFQSIFRITDNKIVYFYLVGLHLCLTL